MKGPFAVRAAGGADTMRLRPNLCAGSGVACPRAHDTVEEADIKPSCVVLTETDPCPHGEFEPKSLTVFVPPHSRVIDGQVYNVTTTPPTCPPGGWVISDVHTFSDGSQDPFSNVNPCRSP